MAPPKVPGYLIVAQLGSGASGVVFRAVHSDLGREVALKLLAPGLFDAEEVRARFLREAKLQARLDHPNLVQLLDAGFAGAQPYLAMEYVPGGTLREWLRRHEVMPRPQALRLGAEIAAGLAHAHQAGIVHRDLKPENIFLNSAGNAKVGDFGLARAVGGHQTVLTAADRILGTPGYLAPEVLMGQPAGPAADLYALGVILFELLAGRRPFAGQNVRDMIDASLHGAPDELRSLVKDIHPALALLVSSCLARDPAERPATALTVVATLEGCAEAGGPEATEQATGPEGGAAQRRSTAGRGLGQPDESRMRATRARTAATVALQGRAEAPLAASTLRLTRRGPALRWTMGLAAMAVVLLAFGLHHGWGRGGRNGAPSGGASISGAPGSGSVQPPAAAPRGLPTIARIDLGTTVARFWFERPSPAGLVFERKTAAGGLSSYIVPAGQLSYRLAGLAPNRESTVVMRVGEARKEVRLATFGAIRGVDGCVLDATVFLSRVISLSVTRGPGVILACWVREDLARNKACQVVERESHDDGETWSPIRTIGDPLLPTAQVQVARCGDGVAMATSESEPGGERLRLWRRSWEATSWTRVGDTLMAPWSRSALVDSEGPAVESLFARPEGIAWYRFPPDRVPENLRFYRRWTQGVALVRGLPGQSVLLLQGALPEATERSRLFSAVSTGPTEVGSAGLPLQAITSPGEQVTQFSGIGTGRRVVVAYTVGDFLRIRESRDGRKFSEPIALPGAADLAVRIPTCCAIGDDVYVLCQGASQTPDFQVRTFRNRSGSREWEPVSRMLLMSPDVCDLRVLPLERHLLILAGERMGGVLLVRVPLRQGAAHR